jgi:protein-disulfide isomerase
MRRKIEALESTQAQLQSNIKSIERQLTEIRTMLQAGGVPRGPVQLPVPKEPISLAGAAVKGDSTAKLVIVEYSDFQCPYCASFVRQTLPMLEKTYISTGKASLAFRNLPIAEIHPQAVKAAETAECARRQGKFWEMHDRLFLDQAGLEDVALVRRGQSLGLDPAASNRCFSGDAAAKIRQEVAEAKELQIMSTPSFFIGLRQSDGRVQVLQRLNGNQPYSTFASALDGILSAAASRK